jgi:hypothetical protein
LLSIRSHQATAQSCYETGKPQDCETVAEGLCMLTLYLDLDRDPSRQGGDNIKGQERKQEMTERESHIRQIRHELMRLISALIALTYIMFMWVSDLVQCDSKHDFTFLLSMHDKTTETSVRVPMPRSLHLEALRKKRSKHPARPEYDAWLEEHVMGPPAEHNLVVCFFMWAVMPFPPKRNPDRSK